MQAGACVYPARPLVGRAAYMDTQFILIISY